MLPEDIDYGDLPVAEGDVVDHHAMLMGVAAGEQRGTGGRADGGGGEEAIEADPILRQGVQVGGSYGPVAVNPQRVPSLLIGEDKQDIGLLARHIHPSRHLHKPNS